VAVDSSHLYWANYGNGTINECSLTDCRGTETSPVTGQNAPIAVAVGPQ
jgi:hypothetical protein